MAKVLVIEDDKDLASMVVDWLKFEHYTVELTHDGRDGLDKLQASDYDAIITDWELPGLSGPEICKQFRADGGVTPIIILTGKDSNTDVESGLDAGADDYVTKPFNLKVLSARLRAVLRRPASMASNVLKVRDLELDPVKYIVKKAGQEVTLLPKEFSLLEFFMRYPDQVFSADALISRVWLSDSEATGEALRTCLKRLRKKLGDSDEKNPIIQTVHGVGYRLRGQASS